MERRSAAEQKSGIGGKMVRTKETNAADPDEQRAAEGTAVDGVSQTGTMAEAAVRQGLCEVILTLLENVLLGNVSCSRLFVEMSERTGQVHASEKELPGISLADTWLAEPEWGGESSEAKAETAAGSREREE
jgi:hypothetical protein